MPHRIAILGSTGSIGKNALEVVRRYPELFQVEVLAAHSNVGLLTRQIEEFKPKHVAVFNENAAEELGAAFKDGRVDFTLAAGRAGLDEAAAVPVDVSLCAIVGSAGLSPLLKSIEAGNRIALANKEALVMAGHIVMERACARRVEIIPVDSEHNAIFQCLHGHRRTDLRCVHLTASGGPFYGRARDELVHVTPDEATKHPTWAMGRKISVDSATLMNKGLEVIEAMWLFRLPVSKIEVVIHPQSVVHSLVEFNDGSILGHLGVTDMKFPILFALTWPERVQFAMGRLDLTALRELTFAAPDFSQFPCLAHAMDAARLGGSAPTVLNAANEVAVSAFCRRQIGFLQIERIVRETLASLPVTNDLNLDAVLQVDAEARQYAAQAVEKMKDKGDFGF